jgi:hypothetical protein
MPTTKKEHIVYGIIMVIVMVYGMICYNISINTGGLNNQVFLYALGDLIYMAPIAFIIESLLVSKIAEKNAMKIITPKENTMLFIIAMSSCTVMLMCPIMSFIATIIHHGINIDFISNWIQAIILNFPMALFYQLFFAGQLVRFIFNKIFNK